MYENIGGLTVKEPGFKSFYVRPEFTERLSFAEITYDSPKGRIEVKWEKEDRGYDLFVKVPFDATAYVSVSGKNYELMCGEYHISC